MKNERIKIAEINSEIDTLYKEIDVIKNTLGEIADKKKKTQKRFENILLTSFITNLLLIAGYLFSIFNQKFYQLDIKVFDTFINIMPTLKYIFCFDLLLYAVDGANNIKNNVIESALITKINNRLNIIEDKKSIKHNIQSEVFKYEEKQDGYKRNYHKLEQVNSRIDELNKQNSYFDVLVNKTYEEKYKSNKSLYNIGVDAMVFLVIVGLITNTIPFVALSLLSSVIIFPTYYLKRDKYIDLKVNFSNTLDNNKEILRKTLQEQEYYVDFINNLEQVKKDLKPLNSIDNNLIKEIPNIDRPKTLGQKIKKRD